MVRANTKKMPKLDTRPTLKARRLSVNIEIASKQQMVV